MGNKPQLLAIFFWASSLLLSPPLFAAPVQLNLAGLALNGFLQPAEDKQQTVFLIVHGTWAHGAMELPATLQSLLEDEAYASLAITLSLGVDNRQGFFDCKSPIVQGHEDAIEEIHAWYLFLREQGYEKVVLIAHSRGGAQAALYQQRYPQDQLAALVLIAPMTWRENVEARAYQKKYGVDLAGLLAKARQYPQGNEQFFTPPGVVYCDNIGVKPQAFISYYSTLPEKNTPTILADVDISTLVYWGGEDPLSKAYTEQSVDLSGNENISIISIAGADHFFRDLYADELVEDFLQRLP